MWMRDGWAKNLGVGFMNMELSEFRRRWVMVYENLTFDIQDHVAILTIDRPHALNAMNTATLREIKAVIKDVDKNPEVRAMVITGSGEKAFVAGADIREMDGYDTEGIRKFGLRGQRVMNYLELLPKPVIAAVNGFALGGGMELALACDVVFASRNARFGLPEVRLGIIPGFGGTQRLPRLVGYHRAKELIFSGKMIDAERAKDMGIVNEICEQADLMPKAMAYAKELKHVSSMAVAVAKKAVHDGFQVSLEEGLHQELKAFTGLFGTADQKEGMKAFLEKREAEFEGKVTGHLLIGR
jgi:enoyl-CoA hydratase